MNEIAAGPGNIPEYGEAPKPMLDGANEYEVVEIFNPLPVDFYGLVGQSKPVKMPFEIRKDGHTSTITSSEQDVAQRYGLTLTNADHPSYVPITNKVFIKSGQSINILGNEAQVIARQLVNELMQREGKHRMLADPFVRSEYEKRIIRLRRSVEDIIGRPQTVQSQLRNGVDKLNETQNEEEFPGLTQTTQATDDASGAGTESTGSRRRRTATA